MASSLLAGGNSSHIVGLEAAQAKRRKLLLPQLQSPLLPSPLNNQSKTIVSLPFQTNCIDDFVVSKQYKRHNNISTAVAVKEHYDDISTAVAVKEHYDDDDSKNHCSTTAGRNNNGMATGRKKELQSPPPPPPPGLRRLGNPLKFTKTINVHEKIDYRFFHSTIPPKKKKEGGISYDNDREDTMKKYPNQFRQNDEILATIYQSSTNNLRVETMVHLVKACLKMKNNKNSAEAAERLAFKWAMDFYQAGRLNMTNSNLFGMAMQAWVNSGHPSSGKRAEILLDKLEELERDGLIPGPVTTAQYNTAMKAYAVHGDHQNVQAIFNRCRHAFEEGNDSARPDIFIWNTLMDSYAKSKNPEAMNIVEEIFAEMQSQYDKGILGPPDYYSYNTLLNAYSKSENPEAFRKAEDLFDDMKRAYEEGRVEPPDKVSYASMINVCAKSNQPNKAEKLLEEMYQSYLVGNKSAQPNEKSFNTVIDGWARSGVKGAAKRCEKILNRMIKIAEEKDLPVKPDTVSYNTVIIAYAREGEPREAERVLKLQYKAFMSGNKNAAPDVRSFVAVIHGWAQAKEDISGERAEFILDQMVELHKRGVLRERPHAVAYNTVINAWAVLGKAEEAEMIFDRMMDDYKNGNKRAKPIVESFSSVCEAHCNANLPDAGEKAESLLALMDDLGVKLHLSECISAIKCWETSLKLGHPRAKERIQVLQKVIGGLRGTKR